MNIRMKAKFVGYIFQISFYFLLSTVSPGPPWIEIVTKKKERNKVNTYALSFYRSQNVLGWSKFFVPDQKFI